MPLLWLPLGKLKIRHHRIDSACPVCQNLDKPVFSAFMTKLSDSPKKTEEIFSLLVDAVGDYAIFVLDSQGYIGSWNKGGNRLKGYTASEIIGQHFSIFYTQDDKDRNHPEYELKQALLHGKYEEEGWRIRKDGTKFWASVVITALRNSDGELQGYGKVTRDLTQKKIAEDSLRESEERFRLLVTSVKDYAILNLDPRGYVTTWNEGAERIKGYSPGEIFGKHFSIFYTSEDKETGKPEYELRVATVKGTYEEEGWRVRKDGTLFWANVVITAIKDGNRVLGFSKVTRDLTERKRAEDNLRLAYDGLEQKILERTSALSTAKKEAEASVKMRDEFLSIASHELKTPLTSLLLQAQLRKRKASLKDQSILNPDELIKLFSNDEKQLNRLARLVDDMLDISKISTGKLSLEKDECDLRDIVTETLDRHGSQINLAKVEINIHHSDEDIIGLWDRFRLEQVFTNLVTNAIKYGNLKPVDVFLSKDSDWAFLKVKDYGIGISADEKEKVFQQFERASNASLITGLGLGLFIVREIVELHGGTITVESVLGLGSEFCVKLPLSK